MVKVNYYKYALNYFKAEEMPQLCASARFGGSSAPPPYVAGFAEVEVDPGTGKVRVLKYVAVADCGTVINPKLARIQLEGGLVMGIGYALQEDVRYAQSGKLISDSFLDYRIPCIEDIPFEMETAFEESYEPCGAIRREIARRSRRAHASGCHRECRVQRGGRARRQPPYYS